MYNIYKITNLINNMSYIGKTNNPNRRWKDHCRLAITKNHKEYDKPLYRAMRKYGIENFSFSILESNLTKEDSGIQEQYWIERYDTYRNGYNASLGGDGGSIKGHCKHEANGRALITKEDVIKIRTLFNQGISKRDCYKIIKDKISYFGFTGIWCGRTWDDIMPEVYTEDNITRNAKLGHSVNQDKNRLFTNTDVEQIRKRKQKGETRLQVFEDYKNIASLSTFDGVWYNRTYKEIVI